MIASFLSRRCRRRVARALLGVAALALPGCANKAEPEKTQQATEKAMPAPVTRPSEEEAAREPRDEDAPKQAEPSAAASNDGASSNAASNNAPSSNAVAIDPARIPVEEDFAAEAENRIPKNSNLEAQLTRIASEINGAQAKSLTAEGKSPKK